MTERGTVLAGRYELDQVIGRGGMAEVWRARDRRLNRDVAVKRLRIDLASDPTFQARFRREAQSAAGLNHPNIVAVYDTGEELDKNSDVSVPYIVMELVEGVTLRDVLRDGRKIVPERALEFTKGVLDALAYSHRAGIVHRDIKPANVMLTPAGTIKVMDFGIARAVADTSATMTQTAAVIGTAQYLSPEQARGEKVDNRSDIYSVGCLLYELLVSQPPFTGDSPVSVAYQHVREAPVAPSQLDPEITPGMDAIVLKALAKDPADRFQDAGEFAADISRALNHEPVYAATPKPTEAATTVLSPSTPTSTYSPQRAAATDGPDSLPSPLEQEEDEGKSRAWVWVLSILGGLLAIGLILGTVMLLNPPPPQIETVSVPDLITMPEEQAVAKLVDLELEPVIKRVAGTNEDKGTVIDQDPKAPAELEVGSPVTIFVSQGPDLVRIPDDIINMQVEDAKRLLGQLGFTNVADYPPDNPADEPIDAKPGEVISSDPAPGAEVPADEPIKLTVATGQSPVPTLRGLNYEEALDVAKRAGFELEKLEVENNNQPKDLIFDQDPQPGELLDRSERIIVRVAIPEPEVTEGPVPNLEGRTLEVAEALAKEAGFKLVSEEVRNDNDPAGKVFNQDPAPGTTLEFGKTIIVQIAVPEPTSPDPSETPEQ